jgi:hypothetical protein
MDDKARWQRGLQLASTTLQDYLKWGRNDDSSSSSDGSKSTGGKWGEGSMQAGGAWLSGSTLESLLRSSGGALSSNLEAMLGGNSGAADNPHGSTRPAAMLGECSETLRCVLCCAVLCCAVLCCAVLCCAVLCCAVLCCAVLCCAVLCCVGAQFAYDLMHPVLKQAAGFGAFDFEHSHLLPEHSIGTFFMHLCC